MIVTADTLTRLRGNRANLERSRAVHAEWVDWLKAASDEDKARTACVGDQAHHEQSVALYDERIACIDIAIELATGTLREVEALREAARKVVEVIDTGGLEYQFPDALDDLRAALAAAA